YTVAPRVNSANRSAGGRLASAGAGVRAPRSARNGPQAATAHASTRIVIGLILEPPVLPGMVGMDRRVRTRCRPGRPQRELTIQGSAVPGKSSMGAGYAFAAGSDPAAWPDAPWTRADAGTMSNPPGEAGASADPGSRDRRAISRTVRAITKSTGPTN